MESSIEQSHLWISDRLQIPLAEIEISFTRSSGPGGQHVNKTSTQAELVFDLLHSPSVTEQDRQWLLGKLASRLDTAGLLRITNQEHRSQLRNKKAALEKLQLVLQEAIARPKRRKKTKPSKSSVEKRLSSKKKDSDKKKNRSERF